MKILFASHNKGKYDELVEDFKNSGIELIFDPNFIIDVEESSDLLIENSRIKAIAAAKKYNMLSIGDDSGVFIEGLDYAPGVHSRRWYGSESALDDDLRNAKVLELLSEQDNFDRNAFLISRFAVANPKGEIICEDVIKNKFYVNTNIIGDNGFGYDKILIPSEERWDDILNDSNLSHEDKMILNEFKNNHSTIAEMPQKYKNIVNNRGRISKRIAKRLKEVDNGNI